MKRKIINAALSVIMSVLMMLTLASCDVVELAGIFGGDRGRAEAMLYKSEEPYYSGYEQSSTADVKVTLIDYKSSSTVNTSSWVLYRNGDEGVEHYALNEVWTSAARVKSEISYDGETVRVSDKNNGFYGMGSCTEEEYYEMYSRFIGNTDMDIKAMIASFSKIEILEDDHTGKVTLTLSGIGTEEDNPCYKQLCSVFAPYGQDFEVSVAKLEFILEAGSYKLLRQNMLIEASSDKLELKIDSTSKMEHIDEETEIIKNSSEPLEELENIKDAYIACLDIAALPSAKSMSFSYVSDQKFDCEEDRRIKTVVTGSFVNGTLHVIEVGNEGDTQVKKAKRTYSIEMSDYFYTGLSDVLNKTEKTSAEYDGYTYKTKDPENEKTTSGVEPTKAFTVIDTVFALLRFPPNDIVGTRTEDDGSGKRSVVLTLRISEAEIMQLVLMGCAVPASELEGTLTKTVTVSYGEDGVIKSIVTVFDFDDGRGNKVNMLSEFRIEEAVM